MILWGPPGTGKTTLARIIAHATGAHFVALSAVSAGVADLRRVVADAQKLRARRPAHRPLHRRDPPLQQSAAGRRPAARRGRHRHADRRDDREPVVRGQLRAALALARVRPQVAGRRRRAHADRARAARSRARPRRAARRRSRPTRSTRWSTSPTATRASALGTLEFAAAAAPRTRDGGRAIDVRRSPTRCSAARRCYDKGGDAHYDTISAFIKTMRGSDPDAAVYWLARMIESGEDPLFIARRLVILASEDVGLADPHALPLAIAAQQAVHFVGMPEASTRSPTRCSTSPPRRSATRSAARTTRRWPTWSHRATTRSRCTCATRRPS